MTEILFTREEIADAVKRVAAEVRSRFGETEEVMVMVLLNGGLWFAADLLRELPANYVMTTVRVSSYGAGTESSGKLRWETPPPCVEGKRVLVLDDVLDSGLTMATVAAYLREAGAAEVASCVVVDKRGRRSVPCEADFYALTCGNVFLVGYGMDRNGRGRNLPYIASFTEEE